MKNPQNIARENLPPADSAPLPPQPGQRKLKKILTKQKLKDSARRIFAEKGFDTSGVSEIVGAAGLAQGSFYYHFTDKKAILIEMLEEFFGELKSLASAWARTTDVGPDAAGAFALSVAGLLHDNRDLARIVRNEAGNPDPDIRRLISESRRYLHDQAALALDLGVRLGVVRPLDTRIAAVALTGMIEEVVAYYLDTGGFVDLPYVIEEISKLQNYGIRPRPVEPVEGTVLEKE